MNTVRVSRAKSRGFATTWEILTCGSGVVLSSQSSLVEAFSESTNLFVLNIFTTILISYRFHNVTIILAFLSYSFYSFYFSVSVLYSNLKNY